MRNAIVVDLDRCSGCFSCEIACKMENGIALGSYYNKVMTVGPFGDFPRILWGCTSTTCCKQAKAIFRLIRTPSCCSTRKLNAD